MTIYPIVEGYGEVQAVPVLIRRLLTEANCFVVNVGRPIRRSQSQFHSQEGVRVAVKVALRQPDCSGILLLLDGEDDCPKELAEDIRGWAFEAAGRVPCDVIVAYREYETWFLAAIESLAGKYGIRNGAAAPADPESRRDSKAALEEFMPDYRAYSETGDQPGMSAEFDMKLAFRRNRSFRKLVTAVGKMLTQLHQPIVAWPPHHW